MDTLMKLLSLLRSVERLSIGVRKRSHTDLAFLIIARERQKMAAHKDRTSGLKTRGSQPRHLGVNWCSEKCSGLTFPSKNPRHVKLEMGVICVHLVLVDPDLSLHWVKLAA
jgi:hypothetical protein